MTYSYKNYAITDLFVFIFSAISFMFSRESSVSSATISIGVPRFYNFSATLSALFNSPSFLQTLLASSKLNSILSILINITPIFCQEIL